ncbi:MAG: FtsW/RodA/SpoVE family cell cycle protein [Candidatus Colwellbacteria bacterium]|nr:FtsW/RodA/SpoVE family cell cycle protein [Candidatus Colwellbacteria bacterium]
MKFVNEFDLWLVGPVLYLIMVGLLVFVSVDGTLFVKQAIWSSAALLLIFGLPFLNLKAILSYRWIILGFYAVGISLLIFTYFFARPIAGTRGWIFLGPFQIQPSEFMKTALVLLFAKFFAAHHVSIANLRTIAVSFAYVLLPAVLVLLQPDLGTALVIFGIWFGYLLVSELPLKHILFSLAAFIIIGFLAWNFGLASYQKERILALFNPASDPLGVNYNVIQSKITIGSAGFFGKGFGQGTQVQLGFLPAATTDFVFSAFTEEWGIIGGFTIIAAILVLIRRILSLGMISANNFCRFICLGTVIVILLHFAINLGSVLGILPVVGVSLPFVSYGGSNLLTMAALIGIIQSIAGKRAGF